MKRVGSFVGDWWSLVVPYFKSEDWKFAIPLLLGAIALTFSGVGLEVLFNNWNRRFYDALQNKDQAVFWQEIITFSWLAALFIVIGIARAIVSPYLRLTLSEHRDQARLVLDFSSAVPPATASAYIAEAVFATLLKFSRILLGGQALFGHVTFQHARHADATTCEAAFQIPVHFSEPINALWFERSLLDQPLRGAFPALHQEAARRVEERVAAQADAVLQVRSDAAAALVRQIEQLLLTRSHLLGQGIQALACEINIHARTLQRRLREVGESHSTILARVRYQLARNWLQDSRLSIELISERLGFTDRRSFTQAFARWSGLTPSQFRRQRA